MEGNGDNMGPCIECVEKEVDDRRCRYPSQETCEADRAAPLEKDRANSRYNVLSTVLKNGMIFDDIVTVEEWRKDFLAADGERLQDFSEEDRNNKELVLVAVTNYGEALEYASDELKSNRDVVLAAVTNDGEALEYASDELKSNRDVVLAAVTNDGGALGYAHEMFLKDREIVLVAVTTDGDVMRWLPKVFKRDREIVMAAVKSGWTSRIWVLLCLQKIQKGQRDRFSRGNPVRPAFEKGF